MFTALVSNRSNLVVEVAGAGILVTAAAVAVAVVI